MWGCVLISASECFTPNPNKDQHHTEKCISHKNHSDMLELIRMCDLRTDLQEGTHGELGLHDLKMPTACTKA